MNREYALRAASVNFTEEQYNEYWLNRVRAKCLVNERGCWIWTGWVRTAGYGGTTYRSEGVAIHRKMYEIVNGARLTSDQCVCHSCDTRLCCNPEHLWIGSKLDNNADSCLKGRHKNQIKTHCPKGHEYTEDNIEWLVQKSGRMGRGCKQCRSDRQKTPEYRAAQRMYQKRSRDKKRAARKEHHT